MQICVWVWEKEWGDVADGPIKGSRKTKALIRAVIVHFRETDLTYTYNIQGCFKTILPDTWGPAALTHALIIRLLGVLCLSLSEWWTDTLCLKELNSITISSMHFSKSSSHISIYEESSALASERSCRVAEYSARGVPEVGFIHYLMLKQYLCRTPDFLCLWKKYVCWNE